jgi:IclR family acetate operon transcriptional repressor
MHALHARTTGARVAPKPRRAPATGSAVAVERAADILFLLADREEMSITELSRDLKISGNAAHRILTALKRKDLVNQNAQTERYGLAGGVLGLARSWAEHRSLREVAWPVMVELRDKTNETVVLAVRSGYQRVCIDQAESRQDVRWEISVGSIDPLHAGATGKVFLAHLDPEERAQYLVSTERLGLSIEAIINDRPRLDRELNRIFELGWAANDGERTYAPGVAGLAAPIYDFVGACSAVLSISVPLQRWSSSVKKGSVPLILDAVKRISQGLGAPLKHRAALERIELSTLRRSATRK